MAELLGVELARVGEWDLASGPMTVTAEMLADAARHAQRPGARPAPLKLGHSDPRFSGDGEPALGWVGNVRVEDVDGQPVLRGDVTDMPDWLAAAAPKAWPYRSIEGWQDYEDDGETYSLVIDGLALLGVTPPGMSTIRSLRDLPQALGVAASARIVASVGGTAPPETPAPTAEDSSTSATSTPPTREGAVGMPDAAKLREALGLKADASDQEVTAALAAAGLGGKAPDAPNPPTPPQPEPQPQPEPEPASEPSKASVAAAGAVPGTITLSTSVWAETQETIKTLKAFVDKTKRDERDQVIASAVVAGKLRPADKQQFATLWDANPDGIRELIDRMPSNTALAVTAAGYAGDLEGDEFDAEYGKLFPPKGGPRG